LRLVEIIVVELEPKLPAIDRPAPEDGGVFTSLLGSQRLQDVLNDDREVASL
jgi:hypothetical protein